MHCVSTILKTQMNRITNSSRCRIIRQSWECSNVPFHSLGLPFHSLGLPHCHCHMWQCILHVPVQTVRQLGECLNVTISQSWIVALSLSHVAMYLTYLCTDSTSIWGVARHYLFTVLNAALSLPHVAMYLTCTCTDSTPMEGVLKSYHFTVVNGRTVIPNMYVCVTCF